MPSDKFLISIPFVVAQVALFCVFISLEVYLHITGTKRAMLASDVVSIAFMLLFAAMSAVRLLVVGPSTPWRS